jgi:hypothetical protein
MKISLKRSPASRPLRPAYRGLEGWALGILIDHGAVTKMRASRAQEGPFRSSRLGEGPGGGLAASIPRAPPQTCLAALDEFMGSIGETCTDCD